MTKKKTAASDQQNQAVNGPQTNIGGDIHGPVLSGQFNAPVILINFINEKVFKRLGVEQNIGFTILALLIVGIGAGLYLALRPQDPIQMAGDFRIAVAGFTENDRARKSKLGMELAQDISERLRQDFAEMNLDFVVNVWGPDQIGWIKGTNRNERASSAEEIAEKVGADIVVYGSINTTDARWEITPEFYVGVENFYEAEEVVGQYEVGDPFSIIGGTSTTTRVALNDSLSPRITILSRITVGLARYALRNYEQAQETFQSALEALGVLGIENEPGIKQVLCLLAGNAAGKSDDLEAAEYYYLQAQEANPDYARVYAGLGNVRYLKAVHIYGEGTITTTLALLEEAVSYYEKALNAPIKPPLSDIESKAHFGLGRAYLMQAIVQHGDMVQASQELAWVIAEYNKDHAERLRERTAEAHKLLGLIYRLNGQDAQSIVEYQQAIALVKGIPPLEEKLAEYYAALGEEYAEVDQWAEAFDAYQKAVEYGNLFQVEEVETYRNRLEQVETQMKAP